MDENEDTTDYSGYGDLTNADLTDLFSDQYDWSGYGNLTKEDLAELYKGQTDPFGGKPITSSTFKSLMDYAKTLLGGKGTTQDYMQLLPLLGGLFGAKQSSNSSILNPGYQGGIPRVTATRTMLTQPPAGRRPGSGGINYGGDVTYARTGENLSAENAGISTPVSQPLGGSSGGAGGAGTQPAVTDLAGLIALLQQLGITVPGQGGQAPAPGAPTPGAPAPSPSFAPARQAAPNEPSIMGTIGGGPDSSNPNDPWYLAHQNEGWEYKNLLGTKGWIKTRPDEPKDAWGAATAQQRREALKGVVQPLIPYDINTPGVKEVVEKFNAANPMPAYAPAAPQTPGYEVAAPQTPGYVGDIQSWYKQNQGGTQEDLNKFLSTSGYSAQQINEALPQYGVSDLEKAIAAAKGVTTAAKGGLLPDGFVIPADVVSHLGNGSSEAGLELLAEELGAKPIKGDGDGMSDSIPTTIGGKQPARVANEEAFVPPDVVKKLGGGDTDRGAKKLYAMMDRIRKARTGTTAQGKQINPEKFMPGGKVDKYAVGGTTTSPTAGITSSSLADWVGPYVADMLGKGQALTEMPYTAYTGPLTAGASPLQQQSFQAAGNLQVPTQFGQAAGIAGAAGQRALDVGYTPVGQSITGGPLSQPISGAPTSAVPSMTGTQPVSNIAQAYMNPYLESVLNPQLRELTRQADITRAADAARMAKAGAFGGSRQAIMESEGRRNLMQQQSDVLGQGYATAYDKALAQFNAEQARKIAEAQFGTTTGLEGIRTGLQGAQTLGQLGSLQQQSTIDNLRALAEAGKTQRDIEAEGIAADKAQFEEARLNPYKMLQFQQSLLSGLPLASQSLVQPGQSNLQQFAGGFSTIAQLLQSLGLLKK